MPIKNKLTDIFLTLWRNQDIASQDILIEEALINLSNKRKKEVIEEWIKDGVSWNSDTSFTQADADDILKRAKEIIGFNT